MDEFDYESQCFSCCDSKSKLAMIYNSQLREFNIMIFKFGLIDVINNYKKKNWYLFTIT